MSAERDLQHAAWFIAVLFIALMPLLVAGEPTGATIGSNATEFATPAAAGSSTTAGGSFTTLVLNATTQTPRWKAYVGNVSGSFTLRDSTNMSIYDWGVASSGGEVYASRNNSVDWSNVSCASNATMLTEQAFLNHNESTDVDTINKTFNATVHRSFLVGTQSITNSTCRSIATYVNDAPQAVSENADFQEILLEDLNNNILVYAALIDQDTAGFDNDLYDFQLIVPEDEASSPGNTYYFWLELS